jgi:hypothetical protein
VAARRRNLHLHLPLGVLLALWSGLAGYYVVIFAGARGHPPGTVFVPFIFIAWLAGVAVLSAIWAVLRALMHKRRAANATLCRSCGYDLRGSMGAGRGCCPECGSAISTSKG